MFQRNLCPYCSVCLEPLLSLPHCASIRLIKVTTLSHDAFLSLPPQISFQIEKGVYYVLYVWLKGLTYCAGVRDGKAKIACVINSEEMFLAVVADMRKC